MIFIKILKKYIINFLYFDNIFIKDLDIECYKNYICIYEIKDKRL